MRLRFWRRPAPEVGTDRSRAEAEARLREAEARLRDLRERTPLIREAAETLADMRQQNGFAEIIELAMRRRRT